MKFKNNSGFKRGDIVYYTFDPKCERFVVENISRLDDRVFARHCLDKTIMGWIEACQLTKYSPR
jgi:hypothetical protein